MIRKIVMLIFMLFLGIGLVLGDALIYAQETEEFTLEEITVTAQKREQNLQKVATQVQAIEGYKLTEMGSVDLQDALRAVASAMVNPVGEEMTVVIRGMDNDAMPGDSFSQVAVTLDGSFSNSWGVGTTGVYDMQRIEVLSGPQGTLYSRNSSGGVVNMISNNPTTERFEASGSVELGTEKLVNTQGAINAPISDAWAVRAAFISTVRDGYSDNGLNDADDRSMRLKLGFNPSDNFSAVLTYEYTKIGGKSQGDGYVAFEDEDDVANPWHGKSNGDLFVSNTQTDRYYMNLIWDTPIGELTLLPSMSKTSRHNIQAAWLWSDGSIGMMSGPGATQVGQGREHFLSPQKERSLELRMASKEDFFMKWMLGLYYYERTWNDKIFHEAAYYAPLDIKYTSNELTATWGQRNNPSKAAFGNITIPFTDAFRFTAGGRYTADEENNKGADRMTGLPTSSHYESNHFDHKLAIEYDLGENHMIWLDYSTGYKHVMANRASQKLKAYQAGSKSRFLNNKMQVNAAAFYYDYKNFDIGRVNSVYLLVGGTNYEYGGSGIGDAVLYGIDVTSDYVITGKDRINLSVSYLSAAVDAVTITYRYQGQESPLVPKAYVDAGKPLNNAPKLSVVANYEHRFDLASGSALTPSITGKYTSKYYLEFYPNARDVKPPLDVKKVNTEPNHIMAEASLNYSHSSGQWSLNGYVKNITNHAEKNGFMRGDLRLGYPRTYGAVLSVRF